MAGLRHHMSLDARHPDSVACEQQNNKVTDQPANPPSLTSAFVIPYLKCKVNRSDIS